jgi:uncharacterized protein (UPF0332 family)
MWGEDTVLDRLVKTRMNQARESLDEAKALLESDMDAGLVVNGLYYAFYYPLIALVYQGKVPSAMQSVVIGLFDQQFIANGTFPGEFSEAIHRAFDLKPSCSGERAKVSQDEAVRLAGIAQDFLAAVNLYLQLKEK